MLLLAAGCVRGTPTLSSPAPSTQNSLASRFTLSKLYSNPRFGFSFQYPDSFALSEQYPTTWPPTSAPSIDEPYIIDLYPSKDDRYSLIQFNVLPKSAWQHTKQAISGQTSPFAYTFSDESETLPLNNDSVAYLYTGNYSPYLYYFQHPSLPYMFTLRFVDPPKGPQDLQLFYEIIGTVKFSKP